MEGTGKRSVSNGRPFVSVKTIRCSSFLGFLGKTQKEKLAVVGDPGLVQGLRSFGIKEGRRTRCPGSV